ncbi:hypothetical protein EG68_00610 [Paragonimus skrjabini miyazakii]|uniref:G-protein coupled receptors family 1 profile domain-containing protein n=1 Tax=Paragonimus skrjabini miyazakii TaxID=59628 RepID=A0A8S9Z3L7_9TREM|nr:hypothetical protein EG68_00610 [Paragonimus skrjabini miyazakii]
MLYMDLNDLANYTEINAISLTYDIWGFSVVVIIFFSLTVITIVGNALVFIALFRFTRLRSKSNLLIGNLALSDFLLALTVLPLSAVTDATGYWIFGAQLCDIWLTVDVFYCTASIWSLVAIAFDRFTATTWPIWYKNKGTQRQVLIYVIIVWVLSGLICLPGLLGWGSIAVDTTSIQNKTSTQMGNLLIAVSDNLSTRTHVQNPRTKRYDCVLFTEPHYVVYSAMGSFILPLIIMIGLYLKIFFVLRSRGQLLRKTRRTREQVTCIGCDKISTSIVMTYPEDQKKDMTENGCHTSLLTETASNTDKVSMTGQKIRLEGVDYQDTGPWSLHELRIDKPNTAGSTLGMHLEEEHRCRPPNRTESPESPHTQTENSGEVDAWESEMILERETNGSTTKGSNRTESKELQPVLHAFTNDRQTVTSCIENKPTLNTVLFSGLIPNNKDDESYRTEVARISYAHARKRLSIVSTPQERELARADYRERRATKRMGLIICIFILSWIPFTLMYMVRGLCGEQDCPDMPHLRMFVTWLGYANSALNPVLYALFNAQFRQAFLTLLHCPKRRDRRLGRTEKKSSSPNQSFK